MYSKPLSSQAAQQGTYLPANSTTIAATITGLKQQQFEKLQALMSNKTTQDMPSNELLEDQAETIQALSDSINLFSLITLVFAILILTCIKRLRSPKNILHLQLFLSFIIRSACGLIQHWYNSNALIDTGESQIWTCKVITVMWQYSLLANYNWILMEGVYLHNLIFHTALSPYGPSTIRYIIFGWTIPLFCVAPWVYVKMSYEDSECWTINQHQAYFWILRAPITISIVLNFVIYVKIVAVLYSKIFSGSLVLQESKRTAHNNYRKLLRSTLVLIPLFGVHYTILLIFQQVSALNDYKLMEVIWVYTEQLFSSSQGFIVACLYCFFNGEVHQEVKALWQRTS